MTRKVKIISCATYLLIVNCPLGVLAKSCILTTYSDIHTMPVINHLLLFSPVVFYHHWSWLLLPVGIGLVAGLLAQMFLPGRGFGLFPSFLLGIAGAWLGNKFLADVEFLDFITKPILRQIADATIGAMALALVINIFRGGKDRDKTAWRHN